MDLVTEKLTLKRVVQLAECQTNDTGAHNLIPTIGPMLCSRARRFILVAEYMFNSV